MELALYHQDLDAVGDGRAKVISCDSLCSESKSSSLNSKLEHESAESQSSQSKGSHSPSKSVCSSSSTSSENIPLQELKKVIFVLFIFTQVYECICINKLS